MGALDGLKVLDLSRILAGPWATQCLSDFGADVVKVERASVGDDTRSWGPPYCGDPDNRLSAYFLSCNRGKRSLAVDFAEPVDIALLQQLSAKADVVVENFKAGGLEKYGLGYPQLSQRNQRLIYCSITGFGQDGPSRDQPGYDAMIQALGGLMSITGVPDGEPGAGPQKVGVAVSDLMCGMYAVSAILAALYHRERSGVGQQIDLSLLDTQVAWLANQGANYLIGGAAPGRLGTAHPNIVPYQAFPSADGWLMLAVGNDRQFASFCAIAQAAHLATDVRFARNADRVAHRGELVPIVAALTRLKPTADWLHALTAANVPCAPIQTLDQVFAHPQVQHRGLQIELTQGDGQRAPMVGNPVKFSGTPVQYQRGAPSLGADRASVLDDWLHSR